MSGRGRGGRLGNVAGSTANNTPDISRIADASSSAAIGGGDSSTTTRLTRDTAASRARAADARSGVRRQVEHTQQQMDFIDVRDEVERMYRDVLGTLGEVREDHPSFSPQQQQQQQQSRGGGGASPRLECPCGRDPCPCRATPSHMPCPCGQDPCPCRSSTTEAAMRSLGMRISGLRSNTFGSARREVVSSTIDPRSSGGTSGALGPGSYGIGGDARRNIGSGGGRGAPRWTTPSRDRTSGGLFETASGAAVPGPGEYHSAAAQSTPRRAVGGAISRASTQRTELRPASTPGPGAYSSDAGSSASARSAGGAASAAHAPSPSPAFRSKTAQRPEPKSDAPGPNAYPGVVDALPKPKGAAAFGKAKRELHPEAVAAAALPGPGQYGNQPDGSVDRRGLGAHASPAPSLGTNAPRRTDAMFIAPSAIDGVPGPGQYEPREPQPSQAGNYSIGQHHAQPGSHRPPSPGPSSYTPRDGSTAPQTHGGALPLAQRRTDPSPRDAAERPGPGDYLHAEEAALHVRPRAASPVVGKDQRRHISEVSPTGAPLQSSTADRAALPGPGAYNSHEVGAMAPKGGVAFSQVKRPLAGGLVEPEHVEQPAPGHYDVPHLDVIRDASNNKVGAVIGDAQRFPQQRGLAPGPSHYEVERAADAVAPSAPAYTLPHAARTSVLLDPATVGNPAPGAYLLGDKKLSPGPAVVMPTSVRMPKDPHATNPSPQQYDVAAAIDATQLGGAPRGPVSFGHADRHDVASAAAMPGASGGATGEHVGPGTYDVEEYFQSRAVLHGGSMPMAPRETVRPIGSTPDVVGPALYDPSRLPTGPAVSFGKAPREEPGDKHGAEKPGPGWYDTWGVTRHGVDVPPGPVSFGQAPMHPENRAAAEMPGPGHYDVAGTDAENRMLNSSRAATFGNAPRVTSTGPVGTQADVPGPASYDPVPVLPAAPQISISTASAHRTEGESCAPGPAAYDPKMLVNGAIAPAISFGNAPRFDVAEEMRMRDKQLVGPGSYDIDAADPIGKNAPAISFGSAARITEGDEAGRKDVPGPASYDLPPPPQAPAVSFGTAARPDLVKPGDGPGPAMYSLPEQRDLDRIPAISFGTAPRQVPDSRDVYPGPAAYYTGQSALSQRAATLDGPSRDVGGAVDTLVRATGSFPGPGQYDPYGRSGGAEMLSEAVNVFFGTAHRDAGGALSSTGGMAFTPGPAYYHVPSELFGRPPHTGPTIPRARKESDRELDEAAQKPGPGWYQLPDDSADMLQRAPGFGTAPVVRNAAPAGGDAPGPGYYAVPELPPLHPGVSIKGRNVPPDPTQDNPGPGHYMLPEQRLDGVPMISFTTAPRLTEGGNDPNAPGPAQYDVNSALAMLDQRGASLGTKFGTSPQRPREHNFDNPGPGQYDQHSSLVVGYMRGAALGTSARFDDDKRGKNEPGPGQYQLPDENALVRNVLIGTAQRFDRAHNDAVPGPGAYDLHGVLSPGRSVAFTTSATQQSAAADVPGPSHYNVPPPEATSRHPRQPAWTIISRPPAEEPNRDVPGPGAYNAADGADPTAGIRHAPSIGTAPRYDVSEFLEASQKPGPCHYDPRPSYDAVLRSAPQISLSFRNAVPQANENIPGPNSYDPGAGADLRFQLPPHWSFGKAPMSADTASDVPGPGYYTLPDLADKNGVPILTAPRFDDNGNAGARDGPGPGAYYVDPSALQPPGPHITFGTEKGRDARVDIAPHSPGAKYNVQYTAVDPVPIAHSFTTSAMSALYAQQPATQATYNPELPPAGPFYSFPRSDAHPMLPSVSPGPIYTIPPPKPPPQWTFGRDPRFHDIVAAGPGPGDYSPPSTMRIIQPVDMSRVGGGAGGGAARGGSVGIPIRARPANAAVVGSAQFVRAKVGAEDSVPGSPARAVPSDGVGAGVSPPQQPPAQPPAQVQQQ